MPFAGELDQVRRRSADTIALRMRLSMAASDRSRVSRAWILADDALSIRDFIEASDEIEFPILQGDQPGVVRRRADCPAAGQSCVSIEPLPLRAISYIEDDVIALQKAVRRDLGNAVTGKQAPFALAKEWMADRPTLRLELPWSWCASWVARSWLPSKRRQA